MSLGIGKILETFPIYTNGSLKNFFFDWEVSLDETTMVEQPYFYVSIWEPLVLNVLTIIDI